MLNETSTNEYNQNPNDTQTATQSLGGSTQKPVFNQDDTDKTDFPAAQEFLSCFPVISVGRDSYVYDQHYWHKTRDGLDKWIYVYFNELKGDKKEIKEIKKIAEAVRCLSRQESFPSYSGEGNVLNFKNTAFNPVTGEKFETFSKEHYCLGQVDFDYDPKATCDEWKKTLNSIWEGCKDKDGKDDRIKLLQEIMFLCLTNITKFEKMLFLYGQGSNGKTKQLVFFSGNVNVIMLDKNYFYEEDKNGKPLRYCDSDGTRWYDENPYHKAKK